ncbi:MAG: NAD(P)H-hydrate epimerase, partial [Calditrichaeota bacterium]|nr:NAD(P)H-hydrate epimerase [Calditrichota bacterium]
MSCILSVEQMKEMDRASVEDLGLAALCLMENAGRGCADLLARRIEEWNCSWPAILCGTGNNGGDGYVIARMLANRGIDCTIFALGKPAGLSPETAANRAIVEKMGLELVPVTNPAELPDLREFDLLIDCVLGTGLKGAARTLTGALIGLINDSGVPVVAIDIPSGVQGDTGLALGPAVIARETLTMAAPKRGLVLQPGRELSGPWTTVDIGYDTGLFEGGEEWQWLTPAALAPALPRRHSAFHKGLAGHVLVIAGSTGLTGAAMLASQAAQRSGAGLVRLALPASLNAICESALPEIMTL